MSQSQQRRGTAHGSCTVVFTDVYCGRARVCVVNEGGWSLQGAETVQEAPE